MVSLLLDYGLDVESKLPPAQDRCTAVFFAVARARNATLIKLLLKRGATRRCGTHPAADYSLRRPSRSQTFDSATLNTGSVPPAAKAGTLDLAIAHAAHLLERSFSLSARGVTTA